MAKKDAYYFSHDCNAQDDPKCMMLIDDLGMEGYGIFWALIEKLRAEKDYVLPISICGRFARRLATSEAKIQAVVNSYGLFEIVDETFFSLRLKRSMEERSTKAKISADARWGKNQRITEQNQCERITIECESNADGMRSDAIKGKEIKGKEIKGNNNTMPEKSGVIAPHEYYISIWNGFFNCETITTPAIERECGYKLKGLTREQVRTTIEKYWNALNGDWSWIETKVDAFSFLTDGKYGFNWFINATEEMLQRKGSKPQFKQKSSFGDYEAVFDSNGVEHPF